MSNLFLLRLDTSADPFWANPNHTFADELYKVYIGVGNEVNMYLNLMAVAVSNGRTLQQTWYSEYINGSIGTELEFLGFKLYFYFPMFNGSFFYNPGMCRLSINIFPTLLDLSVVLNGGSGSPGDGGGSSSTLLEIVLPPVIVPVIAFLAFAVAVTILVLGILKAKKRLETTRRLSQAISLEMEEANKPN